MGLVDGQQVNFHAGKQVEQARGQERLGGHVEQAHRAIPHPGHVLLVFVRLERAVQEQGRDAGGAQLLDLVLHQRDERRDNHGQTVEQQRRDLVAQRFAAAGGHDRQRVAAGQDVLDHFALQRAEGVVAEGSLRMEAGVRLPILPRQAGDLQETGADDILLLGRQGALFDLGNAFHVVHGPDDADRHLDVALGK